VALTFCSDLAAADWIVHSNLPWQQLGCIGRAGFDAYGWLRLLPDPVRLRQSEDDAEAENGVRALPMKVRNLSFRGRICRPMGRRPRRAAAS